ncbi:MAG TPA: hypothetical protein VIJ12_07715, partial [Candidatus Baltobacteraceae bacterium]
MRLLAVVLVGAISIGADAPSADQIFARAWQTWEESGDPPFVQFTIPCEAGIRCQTNDVRITMRTADGLLYIETVPTVAGERPSAIVRGGQMSFGGMSLGFFRSLRASHAPAITIAPDP